MLIYLHSDFYFGPFSSHKAQLGINMLSGAPGSEVFVTVKVHITKACGARRNTLDVLCFRAKTGA